MSSILSREEQLTRLRADREKELTQEKEIVAFAVSNKIFPMDTEYLFDGPGQFPGWHGIIYDLLKSISKLEERSMIQEFSVIDVSAFFVAGTTFRARIIAAERS